MFVRGTSRDGHAGSHIINIPYKFWGLEIGGTYRAILRPKSMPPEYPFYSFDVIPRSVGVSARIVVPKQIPVQIGEVVNIWVGKPEEYGKGGEAVGRGHSKEERAKLLEERTSLLYLNNQLRLQGNAMLAMIGIAVGMVLNIFFDWLLINHWEMGVTGAAVATLISQFISWSLLLWATTFDGNVHIKLRNFAPSLDRYREIGAGGLPSLMRQSLSSISAICMNWAAASYALQGQEASTIAAFTVVARIMQCAMAVILGVGQGFQPVCGFNWGAKLYGRVRQSYSFTIQVCVIVLIVMSTLGWIFAPEIISFFRDEDPELIRIGAVVLRWQCVAFPLVGLTTPTNMLLQNIRRTGRATILAMSRHGFAFYPIFFILPAIWGLEGLEATMATADVITFSIALPFAISIIRELSAREKGEIS